MCVYVCVYIYIYIFAPPMGEETPSAAEAYKQRCMLCLCLFTTA